MLPKIIRLLWFAALTVALAPVFTASQGRPAVGEFDPGLTVDLDLGKPFRLDFYTGREKSEELSASKWKIGGGGSFRLKPVFKSFLDDLDTDNQHVLVVRVGYEYSRASEGGVTKITHSAMLDGTLRYAFKGKILMSDRNRFESRWVDDRPDLRYRNRLLFQRPFHFVRIKITPFGGAEAYWDDRKNKWNLFRYTTGIEIPFFRRMTLDVRYEREYCVTCPDPNTNVIALNLNTFFRLKN